MEPIGKNKVDQKNVLMEIFHEGKMSLIFNKQSASKWSNSSRNALPNPLDLAKAKKFPLKQPT